jgi:hypothetical protein
MSKMTRRDWMKTVGGLFPVVTFIACGGGSKKPTPDAGIDAPAGCGASDAVTMIADNHSHAPHVLMVPMADVQAQPSADKMYNIQGAANHNHVVTITAAQFDMLRAGGTVMDTSTVAVCHSHVCTISCG